MSYKILLPGHLAVTLKEQRKLLGLTQRDVCACVGLLPKTISAAENNPNGLSVDSLFKLLSALGLEMVLQQKEANQVNNDGW